jgi:hypothetical protein
MKTQATMTKYLAKKHGFLHENAPVAGAHEYASQGPKRALTLRDVRNEDRPGYVYENTG